MITFLRLRPAELVTAPGAETRRREGSTAIEVPGITAEDVAESVAAGVLPVGVGLGDGPDPAGWVIVPTEASAAERRSIPGWRLTVLDDDDHDAVLGAVARTTAAFLRTSRSGVAAAVALLDLPGVDTVVSVFVDDVAQAVEAVRNGARDLLLRDWDAERIGELRDVLAGGDPGPAVLVERTALPTTTSVDEARTTLSAPVFQAWLGQVDGSSAARPRYVWAPGMDRSPPVPVGRLSAAWADLAWASGRAPGELDGAGTLRPILERSLEGTPPTVDEIEHLFRARGDQVDAVAWVADRLRSEAVGDTVTYVVNRNINYTNMCYFRCGFCAFSKGPRSLNLRGDPYLMGVPEIVGRAKEAWQRGATEVTLQGGIHPEFTGDFYVGVVEAIRTELPEMHIHGFTPLEVWQGASTLGVTVESFLRRLRDAGLGSLPGTAAEILDDRVRRHLCPDKIRTAQWAAVMETAHGMGLRATATIMFGHIDDPRAWANHLEVVRRIQRRTGGFTEMVPLPFVHMGSPIFLQGRARPGPTWDEVVLVHAVSRVALAGLVENVQASWVKLGLDGAARLLDAGCNDLGGTLMGEIITRSAGASHGEETTPDQFEDAIRAVGRVPVRRNTVYDALEEVT